MNVSQIVRAAAQLAVSVMFFSTLGSLVARYWWLVILAWVTLVVSVRMTAPKWEDITNDGDLAYLPKHCSSVVGQQLLTRAFPQEGSKSQAVIIIAREGDKLSNEDIYAANNLARRFRNIYGVVTFHRAKQLSDEACRLKKVGKAAEAASVQNQSDELIEIALDAFEEAVRLDGDIVEYRFSRRPEDCDANEPDISVRLPAAYHNLANVYHYIGESEQAIAYRDLAVQMDPTLADLEHQFLPNDAAAWPLTDVWTWHDDLIGRKLISNDGRARLIILHLSKEFLSTDNIRVLELIEEQMDLVREQLDPQSMTGLTLGVSGSAAVGGDMLRAARDSIRHTETFTVILVVLVLTVVYRSPLLVAVPLITIGVSLLAAIGITSLLTQLNHLPGFGWWDLKVFTTTKIFIVVILFGSGTDFCLFLISRYREELTRGLTEQQAVASSLAAVGDAIAASALTTICGLSMMFFADFRKFSYSGPVIGLCLAITLAACLTLAPAMLRGLGRSVFWPFHRFERARPTHSSESLWRRFARPIVARPGLILVASAAVMLPVAGFGYLQADHVSYDVLSLLSTTSPSRVGAQLLGQHFDVGESGPITLLMQHEGNELDTDSGTRQIAVLTHELYLPCDVELRQMQRTNPKLREAIEQIIQTPRSDTRLKQLRYLAQQHSDVMPLLGVTSVRSISDPLGNYPPGTKIGLFSRRSRSTWSMRSHRLVQQSYVANNPELTANVARFDLLLRHDPFSIEAIEQLERIDQRVRGIISEPDSYWHGATYAFAGTTAAMSDLRVVTQSDNRRIQILVVVAVSIVLLFILRRPVICFYMVASVLLSYFVTIGIAHLFFAAVYGSDFQGLDWKVPVFLFVILVAVGQDYNVYLVTRVLQEQRQYGPFTGLRRAITRTGGIITSCGVIMAGTFISMTSGTWGSLLPFSAIPSHGTLRSIVELGFALALGVLIDTFVVRTILLPAFLAILCHWSGARSK